MELYCRPDVVIRKLGEVWSLIELCKERCGEGLAGVVWVGGCVGGGVEFRVAPFFYF